MLINTSFQGFLLVVLIETKNLRITIKIQIWMKIVKNLENSKSFFVVNNYSSRLKVKFLRNYIF